MKRKSNAKAEDAIYSALVDLEEFKINEEFREIYTDIPSEDLQFLFLTLHSNIIRLFRDLNSRLPTKMHTAHYWADQSRDLIKAIDTAIDTYYSVQDSKYSFNIDEYHFDIFTDCRQFLSPSGGSEIPQNMEKIKLFYRSPIFTMNNTIKTETAKSNTYHKLSVIGEGSYALVYKYKDLNYNKNIVIKRAKEDLNEKEIERFKIEFDTLKNLSSPYVINVYKYNAEETEFSMEYMDTNLEKYINKNNANLSKERRKGIVYQILKGFNYIHSKDLLHRDINPNNILIKLYEHVPVVKISDFGLVREPNSTLTSVNTEYKGYYNDPVLRTVGFNNYSVEHEIYALCFVIYFVMTGREHYRDTGNSELDDLIKQGMHTDINKRPKNIEEIIGLFNKV